MSAILQDRPCPRAGLHPVQSRLAETRPDDVLVRLDGAPARRQGGHPLRRAATLALLSGEPWRS